MSIEDVAQDALRQLSFVELKALVMELLETSGTLRGALLSICQESSLFELAANQETDPKVQEMAISKTSDMYLASLNFRNVSPERLFEIISKSFNIGIHAEAIYHLPKENQREGLEYLPDRVKGQVYYSLLMKYPDVFMNQFDCDKVQEFISFMTQVSHYLQPYRDKINKMAGMGGQIGDLGVWFASDGIIDELILETMCSFNEDEHNDIYAIGLAYRVHNPVIVLQVIRNSSNMDSYFMRLLLDHLTDKEKTEILSQLEMPKDNAILLKMVDCLPHQFLSYVIVSLPERISKEVIQVIVEYKYH